MGLTGDQAATVKASTISKGNGKSGWYSFGYTMVDDVKFHESDVERHKLADVVHQLI